jgi:hypothetical protein
MAVDGCAESRRVHLPRDWKELGQLARQSEVSLIRRFHRPTGLTESTRVTLAIPEGWPVATLRLNGKPIAPSAIIEERRVFDVSEVILASESHELRIEFRPGDSLQTQPYFVAIEIEEPA